MDDVEREFVRLYAIEGKTFPEIENELGCNRKRVQDLFDRSRNERRDIGKVKALYSRKQYKEKISFLAFFEKYGSLERVCFYCGLTEAEIKQLSERGKIHTKRNKNRGKTLELERVEPNEGYDNLENLRLACFWCNNAKSDEFTAEEFRPIANKIGDALRARLSSSLEAEGPNVRTGIV